GRRNSMAMPRTAPAGISRMRGNVGSIIWDSRSSTGSGADTHRLRILQRLDFDWWLSSTCLGICALQARPKFVIISSPMAIKNYASDKPIEKIFAELQHTLGTHGAKHISFEYGDDGRVQGVAFTVKANDQLISIKLPVRVDKAQAVLKRQWDEGLIS